MIKNNKNITTIFIVPTLGIESKILKENGFLSGYIEDVNNPLDYKDVVYLLFKPTNLNTFKTFLENLYNEHSLIVEDYDVPEDRVVIVFNLLENLREDYNLIFAGKYSQTSEEFQKLFPEEVIIDELPRKSLHKLIFDKDVKLARYWESALDSDIIVANNLEVWTGFDLRNEILDIKS